MLRELDHDSVRKARDRARADGEDFNAILRWAIRAYADGGRRYNIATNCHQIVAPVVAE